MIGVSLGMFQGNICTHLSLMKRTPCAQCRRKDGVTNGSRTATEQSEHHVDNVVVDKTSPGCADGQKDTTSKKFDSRCGNDSIIVDSVSHSKRACCDYEALPPNGRSHKVRGLHILHTYSLQWGFCRIETLMCRSVTRNVSCCCCVVCRNFP